MTYRSFRSLPLTFFLCVFSVATSYAEVPAAEPAHVLRPIVHAQQEVPELCLEYNAPLPDIGNSQRLAKAFHLESDNKPIAVPSKNISLGGNQLCLAALEHRKAYQISIDSLRNTKNETISEPYSLSFTIPARRASLSFLVKESHDNITPWHENPVLRSINTENVTLELFKVTDPASLAEAWQQRLQTTLAPSETLYFVRNKGQLIVKKNLTPATAPDKNTETKIDFSEYDTGNFTSGLYLLAATDGGDVKTKAHSKSDERDKENMLTPTAAVWLVRSQLSVHALRDGDSIAAFAETTAGNLPAENIHVYVMNQEQKILAEAETNASGQASLPLKAAQFGDVQTLVGVDKKGGIGFADVSSERLINPVLPPRVASIEVDATHYMPNEIISATLSAHDLHKHATPLNNTTLSLMHPDNAAYQTYPVNTDANGKARISITAPTITGIWHLVWKQNDGHLLASTYLMISKNPNAPELSASIDRTMVTSEGGLNLSIRSHSRTKTPVPFVAGRVELRIVKSAHPFPIWKDFSFEDGKTINSTTLHAGNFVTNAAGITQLHVSLPNMLSPTFGAVAIQVTGDNTLSTVNPDPLIAQIKPASSTVGIRPRVSMGHFPENSVAHFDIVALDPDGQAHDVDGLTYQIFEQGRNFEWHQSGGKWDYKPQQQQRRIGGGSLLFGDNHLAPLEWPVTAGTYRLQISDADGALLGQYDFNAGWDYVQNTATEESTLKLMAASPFITSGKENSVRFNLAHPTMITTTIADDRIRKIIHNTYPAGTQAITFTPQPDWGSQIEVRVSAHGNPDENGSFPHQAEGHILLTSSNEPIAPHPESKVVAKAASQPSLQLALLNTQDFTLTPHKDWTTADFKSPHVSGSNILWAAPQPLQSVPSLLVLALNNHPVQTIDIANQLYILHQWSDKILASGLLTEIEFQQRKQDMLLQILERQKADGGFSSLAHHEGSDTASTAAVVKTFSVLNEPAAQPAQEQAVAWLHHRLENTWFGDEERPERATAYAALAYAGKLDVASLHYFSDTSANKNLPLLASAQIAYAFAFIKDKPAASYWLDQVKNVTLDPETLSVLLANDYFSPDDKAGVFNTQPTPDQISSYLEASRRLLDRKGNWFITVGKEQKNIRGIFVMPFTEKLAASIYNAAADRGIFVSITTVKKMAPKAVGQRHIYTLEGSEVTGKLAPHTTYLLMREGTWGNDKQNQMALHEDMLPNIAPASCTIGAPDADNFLGWLSFKPLTLVKACEKNRDGLDIVLMRQSSEQDGWRIAYLVKSN